jgi:COP9 signalosome complex subunit 2
MSDDDFMNEDEEFDFDYEGESEEEVSVDLENKYYQAKSKRSNPQEAIHEFEELIAANNEWSYKALKQIIKTAFKNSMFDVALLVLQLTQKYDQLIIHSEHVTKNYHEKSINNILDLVSTCSDMLFLEHFYNKTLDSLLQASNDRLWSKTNLKLAKLWLDRKEFSRLGKIIKTLTNNASANGTLLLEIFALQIQMYNELKDNNKLKIVYQNCLKVKSAIPHPKIMGVIREQGGKMHMFESTTSNIEEWDKAQTDFFEAFKNYDEAGSPQRIQCLKYLVLANMLSDSEINPFDSQETKPYKNDPQITAMTSLVQAFQTKQINDFELILRNNRSVIMDDPFIRNYIDDLLKTVRCQVLIQLVKPYKKISMEFIGKVF